MVAHNIFITGSRVKNFLDIFKRFYRQIVLCSKLRKVSRFLCSWAVSSNTVSLQVEKLNVMDALEEITRALQKFRDDRDWDQFHNPKDLALALSVEAAELNELFLWKSREGSYKADKERVGDELADVLAYAFLMAEKFDLDIHRIMLKKIAKNNEKYPVDKARGKSDKYTRL